jgi:hypothetical protein
VFPRALLLAEVFYTANEITAHRGLRQPGCIAGYRGRTSTPPRHASHLAPRRLALMGVLLLDLQSLHAVDLLTAFALRPDFLAGLEEPANRFRTQLLCFVHVAVQSPACLTLQALPVLELNPFFRLTFYWEKYLTYQ